MQVMKDRGGLSMNTRLLTGFVALGVAFALSPVFAQNATIDARLNVAAPDGANYFNWSVGSRSVKDKLDASSGASLSGSTGEFNVVRYDSASTKKAAIPRGLWGLMLFPLSGYEVVKADALAVTQAGKEVTVRFVHRGVAYELVTDKAGKFDVFTGARMARGIAENVGGDFVLKKEFVKAGGNPSSMADLDWSKLTLVPDVRDPAASRWYEGSVAMAFEKNVLSVKGTLTERKK
jgi:hypothetical protein